RNFLETLRKYERASFAIGMPKAQQIAGDIVARCGSRFPNVTGRPTRGWFASMFGRNAAKFRLKRPSRQKARLTMVDYLRASEWMTTLGEILLDEGPF